MRRAVVVPGGVIRPDTAQGSLGAAGCEAVVVSNPSEARAQVEAGAVVVVVGAGDGEWTGPMSGPLVAMPPPLRRGCVLVLVGPGLTSGDGRQAFTLGVDLVLANSDVERLGEICSEAVGAKRSLVAVLDPAAAARLGG